MLAMQHTNALFKNKMSLMALTTVILAMTGCAKHLSAEQCTTYDMYQMGLSDGNAGRNIHKYADYQTECNAYNISLDQKRYQDGWSRGNHSYCQPSTAFSMGKTGHDFPVVCADNQRADLRKEYNRGFQIHQRIAMITSQIESIEHQLHNPQSIEEQISETQDELALKRRERDESIIEMVRLQAERDIKNLEEKLDVLKTKLIVSSAVTLGRSRDLEKERQQLVWQLDKLKATN